jgi:hypothetical protein
MLMFVMRYPILFLLVFILAAACTQQTDFTTRCLEAQDRVNACLVEYCAESGDEVCGLITTSRGSLFEDQTATLCDTLSEAAVDDILSSDCDAIVAITQDSLSGKADSPCPAYLPWCSEMTWEAEGYDVDVIYSSGYHVTLDVTIDDVTLEGAVQDGEEYERLEILGNGTTTAVGAPAIPMISIMVGAPPDVSGASVSGYDRVETHMFQDIHAWPYQPVVRETDLAAPFQKDPAVYASADAFPGADYELDPVAKWRNYKVLRIKLYPLQYYPALRTLEVTKHFIVDIDFESSGLDPEIVSEGESSFSTSYDSVMVNYQELSSDFGPEQTENPARVRYLIIAVDALAEALGPLMELKDEQLLRPWLAHVSEILPERSTELNVDAGKIRDYIASMYHEHGLEYVLLVGEVEDLPMYEYPTDDWEPLRGDYFYSCLAGDDLLPEVAVGRIPGKTVEEVAAQVDKIVAYSRGDRFAPWRQRVLLVAHMQDAPKKYTECSQSIRSGSYNYPASFITMYGHERHSNQEIIDRWNDGLGIINYRGHGSETAWSGWNEEDFALKDFELHNGDKTPVVFSIACLNGKLEYGEETLSEQMVKRPGGGAVAFLAATKPSWTIPNHDFDRLLFRAVLDRGIRPIGKISNVAKVELMNMWGDDNLALDNMKMYIWLGDPSLEVDVGSGPAEPIDIGWCNIQHPAEAAETADIPKTDIFGQVWAEGHTDLPGQAPFIFVQIGYGPLDTNPEELAGSDADPWSWKSAYYNLDAGNNDEYMSKLLIHEPGEYAYAFRVSGDGGAGFIYCDKDGSENGFSVDQLGHVTVEPRPTMTASDARLGYPTSATITAGQETPKLRSTLTIQSATYREELVTFLKAEAGFGPEGVLPDAGEGWTWKEAKLESNWSGSLSYNAMLRIEAAGTYRYTFRYSMDDGATWIYADQDGMANGLAEDQLGTATVNAE